MGQLRLLQCGLNCDTSVTWFELGYFNKEVGTWHKNNFKLDKIPSNVTVIKSWEINKLLNNK
jgi:hypothetical protein